jgi:hypothetical protein
LTGGGGNKAVVVSFSMNGEKLEVRARIRGRVRRARPRSRGRFHAADTAIWNVTPGGGAGGVWMSGSGPAIDGDDIYLTTGNGMDPGRKPGNFGESFVKLRYTAGIAGVDNASRSSLF